MKLYDVYPLFDINIVKGQGCKVWDDKGHTTMCKENNLPIYVFNMDVVGNLKKVMDGEEIGTLVHN